MAELVILCIKCHLWPSLHCSVEPQRQTEPNTAQTVARFTEYSAYEPFNVIKSGSSEKTKDIYSVPVKKEAVCTGHT